MHEFEPNGEGKARDIGYLENDHNNGLCILYVCVSACLNQGCDVSGHSSVA